MARPKVFISRDLADESPFHQLEPKVDLCATSLIEFFPVPFETPQMTDWYFFYSQQGVKHFFQQIEEADWQTKWAAFGPATASKVRDFGRMPSFVGNGVAEATTEAFLTVALGQSVTFVRAKNSRRSVQGLLDDRLASNDLVVYDNRPKTDAIIPSCDVLVFTSPLNAKVYFGQQERLPHQQIIGIGATTGRIIEELGVGPVRIAPQPSEQAMADLITTLTST